MLEKRRHRRMPVIKQFGEEIMISFGKNSVPGIILDLSADGISLLTFIQVPTGSDICLSIDLPALKTNPINGKVVWVAKNGDMWRIGIHILSINSLDSKQINRMAIDFNDCENKIVLGAPDVCDKKCSYYKICAKPQKAN
jgi:hypothetical protein